MASRCRPFTPPIGFSGGCSDRYVRDEKYWLTVAIFRVADVYICRISGDRLIANADKSMTTVRKKCVNLARPRIGNKCCPTPGKGYSIKDPEAGNGRLGQDPRVEIVVR